MKFTYDRVTGKVTVGATSDEEMGALKILALDMREENRLVIVDVDERTADDSSPWFMHAITFQIE